MDPFSPFEDEEPDREFQETLRSISPETVLDFVLAVLLAHVGLFAGSLGLMLIWFRGQWEVGGALLAGGLLGLALTVAVYRRHRTRN